MTSSLFPQTTSPAKDLYLLDTDPLADEYRYASAVLQGLVNRSQPRIFRRCGAQRDRHSSAVRDWPNDVWRENLKKKGFRFQSADFFELLERFRDVIQGAVLFDRAPQHNVNLVTMLCAQKNALPVTGHMNQALKLPALFDARNQWPDRFAAHDWALEHLWPNCHPRILASVPDFHTNPVDYLVAFKIFTFFYPNWPSRRDDEYLKRMLMLTPPNTPVMGVWDLAYAKAPFDPNYDQERNFIDRVSWAGKFFTVTHEASNLTIHSGMGRYQHSPRPATPSADSLEPRNRIAFVLSEGDNISYQMCNMSQVWRDSGRGSVPITWSLSPAMAELCPDILQKYRDEASANDDFIMATSGLGYMFPSHFGLWYGDEQPGVQAELLRLTREYMERLALDHIAIIDHPDHEYIAPKHILRRYARALPRLKSFCCDYPTAYGDLAPEANYRLEGRVAVFHAQNRGADCVAELQALSRKLSTPIRLYVFISGWEAVLGNLKRITHELEPDYEAVTLTRLSAAPLESWVAREDEAAYGALSASRSSPSTLNV